MGNNGDNEREAFRQDLVTLPGQSGPAKWLAGGMGKDDDFLTLCHLVGGNRGRAYANLLYYSERYNCPARRQQIIYHLRATVSEDGLGRHEIVQMVTGVLDFQDKKKQKKYDERKEEAQQSKR